MLKDMVQGFHRNPSALVALRASILEWSEWDLPEIIEGSPPEAQPYLRGQLQ